MTALSPNFLLERERDRNASTRSGFSAYARHRARQMALLKDRRGERLAVLGAGNCNDLELATLVEAFGEVHLFDIDADALAIAVQKHSDEVRRACHLHVRDLTGVASFLEGWKNEPPEPFAAQVSAWTKLGTLLAEAGQFDTVMSTCLLSQVAINLRDFFGLAPALNAALLAAIAGHVMLASALTKPSGKIIITSDCITSSYPIREEAQSRGALNAILHLAAQGAAFPGTDPELVAALLTSPDFSRPELKDAWLWDVGKQSYLVYALEAVRHA